MDNQDITLNMPDEPRHVRCCNCGKELVVGPNNPGIHSCYDLQQMLRADNTNLRKLCDELARALDDLTDLQNGPPLLQHATAWEETMAESCAALSRYDAMKEQSNDLQ